MDHLDGLVVTDHLPDAWAAPAERRAMVFAAVDALARLHAVDVTAGAVATLGRPDGYLARQVERFASLWPRCRDGRSRRST